MYHISPWHKQACDTWSIITQSITHSAFSYSILYSENFFVILEKYSSTIYSVLWVYLFRVSKLYVKKGIKNNVITLRKKKKIKRYWILFVILLFQNMLFIVCTINGRDFTQNFLKLIWKIHSEYFGILVLYSEYFYGKYLYSDRNLSLITTTQGSIIWRQIKKNKGKQSM